MPVVINEFEVTPAPPSRPDNASAATNTSNPPPQMTAQELAKLVRRQMERALRVSAQ